MEKIKFVFNLSLNRVFNTYLGYRLPASSHTVHRNQIRLRVLLKDILTVIHRPLIQLLANIQIFCQQLHSCLAHSEEVRVVECLCRTHCECQSFHSSRWCRSLERKMRVVYHCLCCPHLRTWCSFLSVASV